MTNRGKHSNHNNGRSQGNYNKDLYEINMRLKARSEEKSAKKVHGKCVHCTTNCAF
jgi:hypothetical protein